MTLLRKSLLGFTIVTTIGLVTFLATSRHGVELRKRDGLLLEMITNISSELDRLDSEYDGITTQMYLAKYRLAQLISLHRDNLLICAMLREKRDQSADKKLSATTAIATITQVKTRPIRKKDSSNESTPKSLS